ncbi:MAG: FHA domain-containing protein [Verrucomicrobiaceae bacterium]|nr:FHA domain-containing protein [Verrucomicrobiaceae bacterium]
MPRIQYTTPGGASGALELTAERMTLGRADDNQLVITDDSVSSHHGEVVFDGNAWYITDLGSTNGTKVGGQRVENIELAHGGAFTLGYVECVFLGDEEEAPAAAPSRAAAASSHTASSSGADFASRSYDRSQRTGFGPKQKAKNPGAGALMFLGVLGLMACGAAIYFAGQLV